MRKLLFVAIMIAVPALAQTAPPAPPVPASGKRPTWLQGPTIVAEPVALALAGFDADQDGLVTRAELIAGAAHSFASVAKSAPDIGYIGYGDWAARWLGDANALPSQFEVDIDRNDRITKAELTSALLFAFDRFDTNRDGIVTRAELVTIRATMFGNPDGRKPGKDKPPR